LIFFFFLKAKRSDGRKRGFDRFLSPVKYILFKGGEPGTAVCVVKFFKMSKTKKAKAKRIRTDTYWNFTNEENGLYFDAIYNGQSEVYYLGTGDVKKDWKGKAKYCWRVYSKKTHNAVDSIRSAKTYRLSLTWAAYTKPSFWKHPEKSERLKEDLPTILTKYGEHCRHLCGNSWCCNPRHIKIGSRTSNEVDKHFHYFLNHEDPSVRERFSQALPDLLKRQGVW
jgi:hypothetical protein